MAEHARADRPCTAAISYRTLMRWVRMAWLAYNGALDSFERVVCPVKHEIESKHEERPEAVRYLPRL